MALQSTAFLTDLSREPTLQANYSVRCSMAILAITTVSEARAAANEWLLTHLPDRFAAGIPDYDQTRRGWRIPVWLSYAPLEPLGPVGALMADALSGDVKTHTPLDDWSRWLRKGSCRLSMWICGPCASLSGSAGLQPGFRSHAGV
jgi:hypothetical protein